MSGKQTNDPAKLAGALLTVVDQEQPPLRWVAGADAVATVEQKAHELLAQVDAYRDLSSSLAVEEVDRPGSDRCANTQVQGTLANTGPGEPDAGARFRTLGLTSRGEADH
jgi:hypothetical protein